MRMNQLPIPARGASTARFGRRMPPSSHASSITAERVEPAASTSGPIPFPHEPEASEGEEIVDLVDAVAELGDRGRQATGGDCGRLDSQLLADAAEDAVDLAGEPVDDPGLQGGLRAAADRIARSPDLDLDELRGTLRECIHRDLDSGRDRAAEVLAAGGDDVVVDARAEVDHHTRALHLVVGGDCIHEA